jgi:hypothetical protein
MQPQDRQVLLQRQQPLQGPECRCGGDLREMAVVRQQRQQQLWQRRRQQLRLVVIVALHILTRM